MNDNIFLCDQDGPLADYNAHADAVFREYELDLRIAGPHEQTDFYYTNHIEDEQQRMLAYALTSAPGWYRELPVTPGAQEGVDTLLSAGWDVVVCTKPSHENPTCRDEKFAWICEHFPMLKEKYVMARDKSLVRGEFLLDDAPALDQISRAMWYPLIFQTTYNGPGSQWDGLTHISWRGLDGASFVPAK